MADRYLPDESRAGWSIAEMCDHGAKAFADGRCTEVRFDIMPNERVEVRAYMAEKHPGVPFFCRWPDFSDRTCPTCQGGGFAGGPADPDRPCSECGGSGKRQR